MVNISTSEPMKMAHPTTEGCKRQMSAKPIRQYASIQFRMRAVS
jgi:hypothetical protein